MLCSANEGGQTEKMLLGEFQLTGNPFRVVSTAHAIRRMSQRGIASWVVTRVIAELGERLLAYNDSGEEVAVIDPERNLAVIAEIRAYKAVVITVIDSGDIFLKQGTRIEKIA